MHIVPVTGLDILQVLSQMPQVLDYKTANQQSIIVPATAKAMNKIKKVFFSVIQTEYFTKTDWKVNYLRKVIVVREYIRIHDGGRWFLRYEQKSQFTKYLLASG